MELDRRTVSKSAGGGREPTVTVPFDRPAPAVTSKAGSQWVLTVKATSQKGARSRSADEPSLPVALGHNDAAWCWERLSTTVCGSPILTGPGHHDRSPDGPSRQDTEGAIRVELHELAALQDYPPGYPFQGNKTAQARQIGNSVPPTLAKVIVEALIT